MTTENNVAAQAGDEPMRKDFEAWAWQECWTNAEIMETRTEEGYSLLSLNDAWSVWKAATLATQVSPCSTADLGRLATECIEALAIGYVEFDEDLDENVCADCSTPTGSEWGNHTPDCLVIRARAAIATTKPGA